MGNEQYSNCSTNEIVQEQIEDEGPPDDTYIETNPLRKYLNHYHDQPIKTLTDIKNTYEKSSITVTAPVPHNAFTDIKKPILSQEIQDTYSDSSENDVMNQNNLKLGDKAVDHFMNNLPHHKQSPNFRDVTIKIQTFIKIKEQSIQSYYQLKEILGEGSYGQVFRAICKRTKEERAIKILKGKYLKEQQKKELLSELTLLSKLHHPCIITLYDLFYFKNKYYVVMQYCKGGNVSQTFSKLKNKSEKIIKSIMKQLLSVLNYIHSQNIVHRDIKLDNMVFLNPVQSNNQHQEYIPIKIIDFGTAVQSKIKVVRNFPGAGTMTYIAPEVLTQILTPKSDLWSAAVLMTILLTGYSPFRGMNQQQTKQNVMKKQLKFNEKPFTLMSPLARQLIQKMFNRNFHHRIGAAEALQSAWFTQSQTPIILQPNLFKRLQKHQKGNNLVSIVQSFLSIRRISQEERQKIAEIFQKIDSDNSGLIDCMELVKIYRTQYEQISEEQALNLLNSIDKNKSGKIDFNQFLIFMYSRDKLFLHDALNEAFDYFDKDKTGYIEVKQLKEILQGSEKAEVEYLIQKIDTDKDNKISREEFVKYLKAY